MDGPGFECRQQQEIPSSPKPSRTTLVPSQPPVQWIPVLLPRVKLTIYLRLVLRLRMSGTEPLFYLLVFMEWTPKRFKIIVSCVM